VTRLLVLSAGVPAVQLSHAGDGQGRAAEAVRPAQSQRLLHVNIVFKYDEGAGSIGSVRIVGIAERRSQREWAKSDLRCPNAAVTVAESN
jgi:hypothetical protein